MLKKLILLVAICAFGRAASAQAPEHIREIFSGRVVTHPNVPYANDTLKQHLLDIYLPADSKGSLPLIIWVHGGAWQVNDKYADMSYMKSTIKGILERGYAFASIDYRYSTVSKFPAQIQDCVTAIQFLHDHAAKFKFDRSHFVLMGFSAGGHLASLLGLALNNNPVDLWKDGKKPTFSIKGVVDFYGPSDLTLFYSNAVPGPDNTPIGNLLGASALVRPDLAKRASPITYVDKNDPPFQIIHGELDDAVPPTQSYLLKAWFDVFGVRSDLLVVKGAPHYGEMFDTPEVQERVSSFLASLKK